MKRRRFLRNLSLSAAGSMVAPTILKSSALGRAGFTAPSDRLRVALVGCAGMGQANLNRYLPMSDIECVALCDVHGARIKKSKEIIETRGFTNSQKEFTDYRELIDWGKFDFVIIAVPDHWHAKMYTDFANAKFDIYGEKPLVRKIREGRIVVDAVKENNIIWQTGSWQRSTKNFVKASELVASGVIGDVKNVEVGLPDLDKLAGMPPVKEVPSSLDYDLWLGPAPKKPYRGVLHFNWRWMMDYSGGQLTDWAGHHLDIAAWSLDLEKTGPVKIEAQASFVKNDLFDVPREFDINLLYKNGIKIKVANAAKQPHGMGTTWYGTEGWIHVDRRSFTASDEKFLTASTPKSLTKFRHGDESHHHNFISGLKNRVTPISDVETAHRSISAALLGEIAYLTGEKLKWNPDTEKLIGASSEANALLTRSYRAPWVLKGL